MAACGGADPADLVIRLALTFAALLCPCGYNVHRNSGIALATIDGSVSGKSAAAAASSGVASTGSPPIAGGGAPAFALLLVLE